MRNEQPPFSEDLRFEHVLLPLFQNIVPRHGKYPPYGEFTLAKRLLSRFFPQNLNKWADR